MTLQTYSRRALAGLAVILALAAPAHSDEPAMAALDETFERQVAAGFTGYAVVVRDGEIIFERGAGIARRETGDGQAFNAAFSPETQFDMASIVKTITGALVAEEIASGRLQAGTTLAEILDVEGSVIAPLTLHQLLTHSAGLHDVVGEDHEAIGLDEVVARASAEPLLYEPGTAYRYSNLGYSLLAAVLEAVSGQSYEALVRERLAAVGAMSTGYDDVYAPGRAAQSTGGEDMRALSWGGHAPGGNLIGNGGMVTTASDMVRWLGAYTDGRLVSQGAVDLAQMPHIDETGEGVSFYGYGMVVEQHPELGRVLWHNGGSWHYNAIWRALPDQGVLIIALANQPPAPADLMAEALERALFAPERGQ